MLFFLVTAVLRFALFAFLLTSCPILSSVPYTKRSHAKLYSLIQLSGRAEKLWLLVKIEKRNYTTRLPSRIPWKSIIYLRWENWTVNLIKPVMMCYNRRAQGYSNLSLAGTLRLRKMIETIRIRITGTS